MQSDGHISVEELESYKLADVADVDVAVLEEHLEWCQYCRDRMLAIGRFLELIKGGSFRAPWRRDLKG